MCCSNTISSHNQIHFYSKLAQICNILIRFSRLDYLMYSFSCNRDCGESFPIHFAHIKFIDAEIYSKLDWKSVFALAFFYSLTDRKKKMDSQSIQWFEIRPTKIQTSFVVLCLIYMTSFFWPTSFAGSACAAVRHFNTCRLKDHDNGFHFVLNHTYTVSYILK